LINDKYADVLDAIYAASRLRAQPNRADTPVLSARAISVILRPIYPGKPRTDSHPFTAAAGHAGLYR
jgi:hypothetical protein